MSETSKPTPIGTWPLLISLALLLGLVPLVFAFAVVPQSLAIAGAVLFAAFAVGALALSYVLYLKTRNTKARGVPIAGVALGVIAVVLAFLSVLPAALN